MLTILQDYKAEWDPSKYHSEKTGRGPLNGEWRVCTSYIQILWY